MVLTLRQFSETWWRELCKKVKKAIVFIDNEAAECLHWNGGLLELLSSGAVGAKEFSSFESGSANQKKAVFITSQPIVDLSATILRDIIQNSKFEYCVLISVAHPSIQRLATGGSTDMAALQSLEDDILQWMGNVNYTAEIFYMPLFIAPVTDNLFVTPTFQNLFPDISGVEDVDQQVSLHHIVSCLHSLFTQLDVRECIFSMGATSGLVASYLEDLPAAISRRKTAVNRTSIILVDRTLDLCTVSKHNADSLLDRIISVLPRLPNHTNDIAVNMSSICNAKVTSVLKDTFLAPGCLSQPNSDISPLVLDWLVNKKQKDVMLSLTQHLTLVSPNKQERIVTRVTPHTLEKQVSSFRGNKTAICDNNGVLQQALAVTQTLKSPRCAHLDMLASLESLQLQQGSSALSQLMQLIKTRHERKLSVEDILCLLVHLYSSRSDVLFQDSEESELESLLAETLSEDRMNLTSSLSNHITEITDKPTIESFATQICDKLQCLPSERYESIREGNGLLSQLINDLFDLKRPDIPELKAKSTALTDLLKTGLQLFMSKPSLKHPLDNPQLIVFVIGGVSAREVRAVQEVVSNSESEVQVIVGGTRLLTASDTMQAVLINDILTL